MIKILRIVALVLLLILSVAAIYGGLSFIIDPSGESIQISIDVLNGTPFNNFLIPGIILFLANGLLSALVVIITIKKMKYYPWFIILQGFVLIGWLTGELIMNIELFFPIMHYPLYTFGVLFIVLGLLLQKNNQNH